jgi:hypothetical protein
MVRVRRDMDPEGNILDPVDYLIWSDREWEGGGWGQVQEGRRLIRYRQTAIGWQEVWMESSGHITYGLYLPEGFFPPPEMQE